MRKLQNFILIIAIIAMILSGSLLAYNLYAFKRDENQFAKLRDFALIETDVETDDVYDGPFVSKYAYMKDTYQYYAGWITIPNTAVNYPVMNTPHDVEYYLRRNIEGSYSSSGVPFVGYNCSVYPNSDHLIIYGHNMKNGSMFSDIKKYTNKDFWQENKIISFETLEKSSQYEVFAIMNMDVAIGNGHFEFYNYINFHTQDIFDEFLSNVKKYRSYSVDNDPVFGDEIISLVTCGSATTRRYIVMAKLIEE